MRILTRYILGEVASHALIGRHTKQRYRLGDRITVQVVRVDKLFRRAYFLPVVARKRGSR